MADPLNIVTIAASANILKRGWGRECCYVELKMRLEKLNGTQTDTPCTRDSRTMKNAYKLQVLHVTVELRLADTLIPLL